MKLSNMTKQKSCFVFHFSDLLKTCGPNNSISDIDSQSCPPDRRLCVYFVLFEY